MVTSPSLGEATLNAVNMSARDVVIAVGWVLAGVMLLVTSVTRWFRSGIGSQFGGLELADNIRSGVLSPSWGVWVALCIYSLVGVGGLLIATAVVRHSAVVLVRGVVSLLGLVVFVLLAQSAIPLSNWAAGPTIASLSFLLATVLSAVQLIHASRN